MTLFIIFKINSTANTQTRTHIHTCIYHIISLNVTDLILFEIRKSQQLSKAQYFSPSAKDKIDILACTLNFLLLLLLLLFSIFFFFFLSNNDE